MAKDTSTKLRQLFLYQVYVRNHTKEGTFKSFQKDLDRIKKLGVDIVYFYRFILLGNFIKKALQDVLTALLITAQLIQNMGQ